MSWRTIMRAGKTTTEKNQEPTKPPTIRTKPIRQDQESPQDGGFVPFVGESPGSHILQPGDQVTYTIPQPDSRNICPAWVEHIGLIVQVDPVYEMVLIVPENEPGVPWRWVALVYVQKVHDGQA